VAEIYRDLNRKLAIVSGAFALGFSVMMAGVAILDSRQVVGFSLAWLTGVVMYSWLTFRCPLCDAAVFNAPAGKALGWIVRRPRSCPRCRAEFAAAMQALRSAESAS
jgi:hypothetical protein